MIKKFNKDGIVALYKREFAEYLDDGDYESALDILLKYREIKQNDDFHSACGMLYLLMAQDSDDNELLSMAFREFMMHLRKFPYSRFAHRGLLAVQMLRHDVAATFESAEWAKAYGVDTEPLFEELSEAGIDLFSDDDLGLALDDLLMPGDFGEIDVDADKPFSEQTAAEEKTSEKSDPYGTGRIIKFRGGNADLSAATDKHKTNAEGKVIPIHGDDYFGDGAADWTQDFMRDDEIFDDEDPDGFDDGIDAETLEHIRNHELSKRTGMAAQIALREAERCGLRGDYDGTLKALSGITPADGHYYYCAECMRAFTYFQQNDENRAKAAIDRALKVKPDGALIGMLLCKYYEINGQTTKIREVLKNIDVKDYTDASHVYQAMRLAVKYCKPHEAAELAEQYIDEFNTMDVRMLYAQLLYNCGRHKEAIKELYALSRIFYDDFNAMYYYASAVSGVAEMPVDEEAPQKAVAGLVEGFMWIQKHGLPDDELIKEDEYLNALELFLTLEYSNERKLVLEMFDCLRSVAADRRLEWKMRDTLVSPYAEPIVKAVILADLFDVKDEFVAEFGYCPVSERTVPFGIDGFTAEFKKALAYVLAIDKPLCVKLPELAKKIMGKLNALDLPVRDKVYYILKMLKKKNKRSRLCADIRIEYSLGYETKSAAVKSLKAVETAMNIKI